MAWGAAAAGIVSSLASAASSIFGNNGGTSVYKSNKLMALQNMYQQDYLRKYYTNARQSLNAAGYNPMLAYMSTPSGGQTGATAQNENRASAVNEAAQIALNASQQYSAIQNTNANTTLQKEQARTEQAKRIQMDFQNAMTDVETHLKRKDLSTYDRRFYSNLYEQMQRAENYRAQTNVTAFNAQTARMNAQANVRNAATNVYNAESERMNAYSNSKNANTNRSNSTYGKNRKDIRLPFGFGYSFSHDQLY